MELENVYRKYQQLLPSREEGMVIFRLQQKIRLEEINENFTYSDLKKVIQENAKAFGELDHHAEPIIKNLLYYFIERPSDQKTTYKLTEYAHKFIDLVYHKLDNPLRKFPLSESFKRYAAFQAEEIVSIEEFESWFEQGFQATTRQNIIEHLEALKDDVDESISQLNKTLYEEENILTVVSDFTSVFEELNSKTDEIRDALRLGANLEREVQSVVSYFYDKIEGESDEEKRKSDYQKALSIQSETKSFFLIIDEKIGQLRGKIIYASRKLNDLQENFRYQTRFKRNIRKLLEFTIDESFFTKEGPSFKKNFPVKQIPSESFKFTVVPYFESFFPVKFSVNQTSLNPDYELGERRRIQKEISKQEKIQALISYYKEKLVQEGKLDFTEHFYKIIDQENDLEIALNVGYDLLLFVRYSPNYQLKIDRSISKHCLNKNIITWQTNIRSK
ncbi:MAG: hypothetical protein ACO1O6_13865 [Bacteroidota bacterium]